MPNITRWLRMILAAATAALAVMLCLECAAIYIRGNSPGNISADGVHIDPVFTRENTAAALRSLAPLFAGYSLLAAVTGILHAVYGTPDKQPGMTPENRLRLMKRRTSDLPEAALREERLRLRIKLAAGAVCAACLAFIAAYMLRRENFTSWELDAVLGRMLMHTLPWLAVAFAAAVSASYACARSAVREADLLKGLPKDTAATAEAARRLPVNFLRAALLAAGAVFIALGIANGGMRDVLVKAINICTECIGLG